MPRFWNLFVEKISRIFSLGKKSENFFVIKSYIAVILSRFTGNVHEPSALQCRPINLCTCNFGCNSFVAKLART